MGTKIKKIAIFSILFFAIGFIGAFLGKGFEKTKIARTIEGRLGIIPANQPKNVSQSANCSVKQEDDDQSTLFIGCNGFF